MCITFAIKINVIDPKIKPIVRIIDDWFTAESLAMVFKCKVGKGSLIVSAVDLLENQENRLEARQLLHSLRSYMSSKDFNPPIMVESTKIKAIFN